MGNLTKTLMARLDHVIYLVQLKVRYSITIDATI